MARRINADFHGAARSSRAPCHFSMETHPCPHKIIKTRLGARPTVLASLTKTQGSFSAIKRGWLHQRQKPCSCTLRSVSHRRFLARFWMQMGQVTWLLERKSRIQMGRFKTLVASRCWRNYMQIGGENTFRKEKCSDRLNVKSAWLPVNGHHVAEMPIPTT